MPGVLDGIRVLEVANFIAGPYASMLLADLGAEVIKVENPQGGDPFRGWGDGDRSPSFWAYNRGKKSLALDLRNPAARTLLHALVKDVDVLVENMRPGVMERLGLGYQELSQLNPGLIYCSVTGFGQTGPYAERPAYDGVGQALSGLLSLISDLNSPRPVGPNFADSLAGLFGAYGVLGALVARNRTGRGQRVDTSLVGATLGFLVAPATETLAGQPPPGPSSRPAASQTYAWTAADGLPLTVHLSSPPKFWEGLTRAVGREDLRDDPRFQTVAGRRANYHELGSLLAPTFATRPREEWLARLAALDVPCAPIYDLSEVFADPQIQHMGLQIELPRDQGLPIQTVASPVNYSETPCPVPATPPDLGQQTDEILERLGYSREAITALRASGVI